MPDLKVVHVITGLGAGGAEAMLVKLLSAMNRAQFRTSVISLNRRGPLAEHIEALGIGVEALDMDGPEDFIPGVTRLRRSLLKHRATIVQGWMYHGNLAVTIASRSVPRTSVLWNIRQSLDDLVHLKRTTRLAIRLGAWMSRLPRRIIYNSRRGEEQHIRQGYFPRRSLVIPNGFDCDVFRPNPLARRDVRGELGLDADDVLIGQIGRSHPSKDHANFLRAASIVSRQHSNTRFALVGAGNDSGNAALKGLVHQLGLDGRVALLGERKDIPSLTAAFDIASLSSVSEGFPNVVGEAMACGVPCTVTDVGDAASIVGNPSLVAPRGDPAAIAALWSELIACGTERRQLLGANARQRILNSYSLSSVSSAYEAVYRKVAREAELARETGP